MKRVRTLVVDDSAFARKVVREVLSADPRIEVVGIARDGLEALEKIIEVKPDVITLDLVMPNLDGLGVLKALPSPRPAVVIVSISDSESDLGILALESGAVDLVHKPTALATAQLYELGKELVDKVLLAAGARAPAPVVPIDRKPALRVEHALRTDLVVIGTSTGGPQALTRLLTSLPADFPVPIAMVLHIPAGYTLPMAKRLDELCAIEVAEAVDGMQLRPGLAILARGGEHLSVGSNGAVRVGGKGEGDGEPHTPSVDVLFRSAARAYGSRVLGVVLTGMGSDGLEGSRQIVEGSGRVIAESESSCIVYGMPRSIVEAGLAAAQAPLDQMAALIQRLL
jgi:two-component system chemotaxis response regulator CheB